MEEVLARASADVSQCVSFDEEKVRDVDKVDHEEPKMSRREIDRSPVATQFQIPVGVVIAGGFKDVDVGCHFGSFFLLGCWAASNGEFVTQRCGERAKRT